jgi:AcrR family transcriptional regulator
VEIPNPPWHREPRRESKPQLSQELIVKTALEILAAEGIESVSMRRIARALDTGPASLYAHVSNKDELDELMFDRVLAGVPLPQPDPERWIIQLKELLRGHVQAMLAYPGIAKVAWSTTVPVGPNVLQHGETILALLRAGGLSIKQAAYAADALSQYTRAFADQGSASGDIDEADVARRGKQMWEYMNSLPPGTFPNLLRVGEFFNAETASERFQFALDMFLGGLANLAESRSVTTRPTGAPRRRRAAGHGR